MSSNTIVERATGCDVEPRVLHGITYRVRPLSVRFGRWRLLHTPVRSRSLVAWATPLHKTRGVSVVRVDALLWLYHSAAIPFVSWWRTASYPHPTIKPQHQSVLVTQTGAFLNLRCTHLSYVSVLTPCPPRPISVCPGVLGRDADGRSPPGADLRRGDVEEQRGAGIGRRLERPRGVHERMIAPQPGYQ